MPDLRVNADAHTTEDKSEKTQTHHSHTNEYSNVPTLQTWPHILRAHLSLHATIEFNQGRLHPATPFRVRIQQHT